MKGVDLSDQLIAYYRPQVQCRRYWLAMFFHGLDIVRVNSYVVASWEGDAESQKQYLVEWIEALTGRSNAEKFNAFTRARTAALSLSPTHSGPKRTRMSNTKPELPNKRLRGHINQHEYITDPEKKQRLCVMCHWKAAKDRKQKKENIHKTVQTRKICNFCNMHLCRGCFDAYHKKT